MKLKGLKAVVTGANRGLGLAIARAFAAEGAELFLGARDSGLLEKEAAALREACPGSSIQARKLDVKSGASVKAFMKRVSLRWDRLDVLVNNAGVYGPKGPLQDVDLKEWLAALDINLGGVARMCQACFPLLKAAKGRVINLSGGGATAPLPNLSVYAASKAGVVRLTETLAHEWKTLGIEVNAVAPGALNTRLADEILEAGPGKVGREFYDKTLKQKKEGGTPLEKGAGLCVYLASAESRGVTGRLISAVWDPWPALASHRQELEETDIYTLRRIVPGDRGKNWV